MRILDAETVRRLMADRNISQVARQTGIHQNTLYRFLSGKTTPSYNTLKKLNEYLTATFEEILNQDGTKQAKRTHQNVRRRQQPLTNKTRRHHEQLQAWPYTRPRRDSLLDG